MRNREMRNRECELGMKDTESTCSSGFTLLELVIAFAILSGGLAVLAQAQMLSLRSVRRAKLLTVATQLARARMVELEDELKKEGLGEFSEQEEAGDFSDEGFLDFRWQSRVEKVELPGAIDLESALGAGTGGEGGLASGLGGGLGDIIGQASTVIAGSFETIRNMLEASIRKVTVTVLWNDGTIEQKMVVQAYFTDPTRVDATGAAPAGQAAGSSLGLPTIRGGAR